MEQKKSAHLLVNSQGKSCNFFVVSEGDITDEDSLSVKLYYEISNCPLNNLDITSISANGETDFEKVFYIVDQSVKTSVVQVDKEQYMLEILFFGKECVARIDHLMKKNEYILNLSLRLKSMFGIEKNVAVEINFEGVSIINEERQKISNITYKYKEEE
jgi:hypothetical protein